MDVFRSEGMSYCRIDAPDMDIPILPFRTEDKLIFPTGSFMAWQAHNEVRYSLQHGYKIKPFFTYRYRMSCMMFRDFVDDIYQKRMEYKKQGSPLELMMKIFMNSLYGKFAQRLEQQEIIFIRNKKDIRLMFEILSVNESAAISHEKERYKLDFPGMKLSQIHETEAFRPSMYYLTDTEPDSFPRFINPILSIYTTAYARIELHRHIMKCSKVYYADTDSLFTPDILPEGQNLGELKKESDVINAVIIKPKLYHIKTKEKEYIKSKGMKIADFQKFLETGESVHIKFSKFKESIRRNIPFNRKIMIVKNTDFEDDKRQWKYFFNPAEKQESRPLHISLNDELLQL
jgi:hypothetical protein